MPNISEEEKDRWEREVTLVQLTSACPYCDGAVDRDEFRNPDDERIQDYQCTDCGKQWIASN